MTFIANTAVDEGGRVKTDTTNDTVEGTLNQILQQLKITNLHLSILTDNDIRNTEVE